MWDKMEKELVMRFNDGIYTISKWLELARVDCKIDSNSSIWSISANRGIFTVEAIKGPKVASFRRRQLIDTDLTKTGLEPVVDDPIEIYYHHGPYEFVVFRNNEKLYADESEMAIVEFLFDELGISDYPGIRNK